MYNYYQNNLTSPLCSLFTRNCEIHEHYTRRRNDPSFVAHSTHLMTKGFIFQGSELWSALPSNRKEKKYVSQFKGQLKIMYKNVYAN